MGGLPYMCGLEPGLSLVPSQDNVKKNAALHGAGQ